MKIDTTDLRKRFWNLALSQKISIIFAVFFLISSAQQFVDHGRLHNIYQLTELYIALGLITLAFFDNIVIRILQVGSLLSLGLILLWTNAHPSDLSAFVLISVALAAAYKMSLFGKQTRRGIAVIVLITIVFAVIGGTMHDFTLMQRVNIVNFILAYMALLYVIFEEETLSLRKQRDILTAQAEDLLPFAQLGSNAAGLVHDFKGDIAGLSALASIERISDNHETAERLRTYADRLNNRVDAILDIATARDHYEPEPVDLKELLTHVQYVFFGITGDVKHAVQINLEVDPDLTVHTRRNALTVILENVIKNSIEATETCVHRKITILCHRGEDSSVVITISHNGHHLPPGSDGDREIRVRRSNYFRRGKSGKAGGAGIGMINVIRALEVINAEMMMRNLREGVESRIILADTPPTGERES